MTRNAGIALNSMDLARIISKPTATPKEVMAVLDLGRERVYRSLECGEIPSIRAGRAYRIPTAWLRDVLHLEESKGE